jgi:hypothetical protein
MPTLTPDLILDEPQVAGPLAVFPVLGDPGTLRYRSFAQAAALGAFVKELDEGASVNDLLVANPTDLPLLALEGEEVLGAQQNRTFDGSVLVLAGKQAKAPVSCVERGRWDGGRAHDRFAPSPQAADPGLRRVKRERMNARAAAGQALRADQGEVWAYVQDGLARHEAHSPSEAMHDVYEARRDDLHGLAGAIAPLDGQLGAVAVISGAPVALDLVSRPEVFADLLPRLAQGYALEAIDRAAAPADRERVERFLRLALDAPRQTVPTAGAGRAFAMTTAEVTGGGLVHEGELVQLAAFPGRPPAGGRIARPSRRHRA